MRHTLWVMLVLAACGRGRPSSPDSTTLVDSVVRAPDGAVVPRGDLGLSILRGRALMLATRDSLPGHVGNALRCTSCHLGDGRDRNAIPLTGVYARFPQYRSRTATVQRLEDRINDCFLRSLNGTALRWDDPAMRDIVAYLAFISRGIRVGDTTTWRVNPALHGDTAAGGKTYTGRCARCHGDGITAAAFPPLWGPLSFSIGAGMARLRTAATFIRYNMPRDSAGALSDAEALNVAAYVTSRTRPDFAGKERDWPRGDAPPDVAYRTIAGSRP